MIQVFSNGTEYQGFTSVSISTAVDQLCNQFQIECSSSQSIAFPIPRGAEIEIKVDDQRMLVGNAEKISGSSDSTNYSISISGRDKSKVIVKTDMPIKTSFKGPVSLKAIMERCLKDAGIDLPVFDDVGDIENFTNKEIQTFEIGGSIWDFWISLAEKRQVIITSDYDSNIRIIRPNSLRYDSHIIRQIDDRNGLNNINSSEWDFDDTERRQFYNVTSQYNFSVPRSDSPPVGTAIYTPNTVVNNNSSTVISLQQQILTTQPGSQQRKALESKLSKLRQFTGPAKKRTCTYGTTTDEAIDDGSICYEVAEHPSDNDECERLAKWRCNIERVKSVTYNCETPFFVMDGKPWTAGYIVPVDDEIAGINSDMMITGVQYTEARNDEDGDSTVSLSMTVPDAFSTTDNPTDTQLRVGVIGANWNNGAFQ